MLTVRSAQTADREFIVALTQRLANFPVPRWRTEDEICSADHRILQDALDCPNPETSILIVEEQPGQSLGYVFSTTRKDYFTGEPHAHVEILAVETHAEGRGVARRLMGAAECWAAERGYRRITLNVFSANDRARSLYDRLGYEPETLHYHKWLPAAKRDDADSSP